MDARVAERPAFIPPAPERPEGPMSSLSILIGRASHNPVGMWHAEASGPRTSAAPSWASAITW